MPEAFLGSTLKGAEYKLTVSVVKDCITGKL